jgi:uncharacterized protein YoxC
MPPWLLVVLALCAVAVTVTLVPALLALRRVGERAERVLAVIERDLEPLVREAQGLVVDLRGLSQEAHQEVKRVSALTERVEHIAEGMGRVLAAIGGLTRVGQLVGLAAGLKTGLDVFFHRLARSSRRTS